MESEYLKQRRQEKLRLKEKPVKKAVKAIAKVSPKMRKIMSGLKKQYAAYLSKPENELCKLNMIGCTFVATVIHHTKGRIGKLLTDEKYWMPSCTSCNLQVEIKDKEAREKGLKLSKFK